MIAYSYANWRTWRLCGKLGALPHNLSGGQEVTVGTPHQLLIVEDEADTSAMLQEYFGLQGYEVRVAAWGEEAIAQCREDPPDLIVLDVRLPDIDGYEVYARLRRQIRTQNTPVIFLTRRRSRDDKITGLQLGAVDYITKPFDLEELSLRVRNALLWAEPSPIVSLVTSLPIGREMEERLRPLVGQGEWAVLLLRLQNLESIGEARSFPTSDEALRTVAKTLDGVVTELGGDKDFVGHLSEADFVLVTSPARVEALREEIVARLPRALRWFARGGGSAVSRFSVGIGVLTNADLPPDEGQDIGHRLTGDDLPLDF